MDAMSVPVELAVDCQSVDRSVTPYIVMPEHIRAFIVVFVLGAVALQAFVKAAPIEVESRTLNNWRASWLAVTSIAFLAHNVWVYCIVVFFLVQISGPSATGRLAVFLLLLMSVPAAGKDIPGMGVVNYLFTIDHPRLLVLALLLPAFLTMIQDRSTLKWGGAKADRWVILYILITALLQLRATTFTDSLRGVFYIFLEVFLPYYVASRALRSVRDFSVVFSALVMSGCALGLLALFEFARGWNLYAALPSALGTSWGLGVYLFRDGFLRASVTAGQAIVLGYVMVVAIGAYLYLVGMMRKGQWRWIVLCLLISGLVASLSRGPWLGAAFSYLLYLMLGKGGVGRTVKIIISGGVGLALMSLLPFGQRFLNMMPFFGEVDNENVVYRQRLLENSYAVIERNFWFGSVDYLKAPEMLEMMQGQGIIDIVNTYVGVALEYGVVGLFVFLMIFFTAGSAVYGRLVLLKPTEEAMLRLGRALLSTLLAVLFMIFTVSSISVIPMYYWMLAGLCVAFASIPIKRMQKVP